MTWMLAVVVLALLAECVGNGICCELMIGRALYGPRAFRVSRVLLALGRASGAARGIWVSARRDAATVGLRPLASAQRQPKAWLN